MLKAIHHIQITVAPEEMSRAKDFYVGVLGMKEIEKPEVLEKNGGFWMRLGRMQIHVGLEAGVDRYKTKAHLAYQVDDLDLWRQKLQDLAIATFPGESFWGCQRFECRDPFGNRLEFIRP